MPDEAGYLGQAGSSFIAVIIEKTQFHPFSCFREHREVGSCSIIGSA
jgi:hypothetical protein